MAFAIFQYWAPLFGLGISAACFLSSPKAEPFGLRIATSSHGAAITILYFSAMHFWGWGNQMPVFLVPFNLMLLFIVVLIIVSLIFFRGPKILHLLQPLNLILLADTWFCGTMAITGSYL